MAFGLFKKKKQEKESSKGQSQFISLHIKEVVQETADIMMITLELEQF